MTKDAPCSDESSRKKTKRTHWQPPEIPYTIWLIFSGFIDQEFTLWCFEILLLSSLSISKRLYVPLVSYLSQQVLPSIVQRVPTLAAWYHSNICHISHAYRVASRTTKFQIKHHVHWVKTQTRNSPYYLGFCSYRKLLWHSHNLYISKMRLQSQLEAS